VQSLRKESRRRNRDAAIATPQSRRRNRDAAIATPQSRRRNLRRNRDAA
jgi:hypothetical protein